MGNESNERKEAVVLSTGAGDPASYLYYARRRRHPVGRPQANVDPAAGRPFDLLCLSGVAACRSSASTNQHRISAAGHSQSRRMRRK